MIRKKAIQIGAVFLAAILFFTFVSRAAASVTTAVAETGRAVSGKISHRFSESGKVEAVEKFAVVIPEGLTVTEICVHEGEQVEAGGVLLKTAGNTPYLRAKEDFFSYAKEKAASLATAMEAYVAAYDSWIRYLEKTETWYWKADDDLEEDRLEREMRQWEYTWMTEYQEYLDQRMRAGRILLQEEDGSAEEAENQAVLLRQRCTASLEQLQSARAAYWEYVRNRDRVYQFERKEDEQKLREALEEAIPDYQKSLSEAETELTKLLRSIADAACPALAEDGTVAAETAGTVDSIQLTAGQKTTSSAALTLIRSDLGGQLTVQIPAAQEAYVGAGDPVTLKKYGSAEELEGYSISTVEESKEDPDQLDVTIQIPPGSIAVGETVTAEFGKASAQYSTVVPASAIHTGGGETYLLTVEESAGILGTVLKAEKLNITILEQDAEYAAISGDGLESREIIIRSDREVSAGSRVRKQVQ